MKATELKSEGLKKEFKIVIPAKDFEQKVDDKLNEVSKNVKLPGFRPGKAPKAMLKQKYKASVMGEVVDEAVRSATEELIKDKKLRPAMMPDVKITAFGEGKDLEFEVSLEELPEIKAGYGRKGETDHGDFSLYSKDCWTQQRKIHHIGICLSQWRCDEK